jgi:peroxiredoxin
LQCAELQYFCENLFMKAFVVFFLLFSITPIARAQQKISKLTDNSVVKDSSGTVYPADVWKPLMFQGYSIKPVEPSNPNTEFIIYRLSEDQKAQRLSKMPRPKESAYFKTGEKFSSFKTTDINGNKIDIKALEGKIIVLNFWFIDCHPCRMEIPDLNNLVDSFKTNDKVVFIAIGLDNKASIQDFIKKLPFNYLIIDNGRFLANQYRIMSYPTHVVIDQERKVYFHTSGLASNTVYWIRKCINELLEKGENKTALIEK